MSSVVVANTIKALGTVSSDGSTISRSAGVTFAKTGTGTYTITLSQNGIDADSRQCFLSRRGAASTTDWNVPSVTQTSDTTMTVTWSTGTTGTPTDTDFDVLVTQTPRIT